MWIIIISDVGLVLLGRLKFSFSQRTRFQVLIPLAETDRKPLDAKIDNVLTTSVICVCVCAG